MKKRSKQLIAALMAMSLMCGAESAVYSENLFNGTLHIVNAADEISQEACVVTGRSITLDGCIGVKIYLAPCEALAKVTMNGPDGDVEFTDFTNLMQQDGTIGFSYYVRSPQTNELVTLKAYDSKGKQLSLIKSTDDPVEVSQVECSVSSYIDSIKSSEMYNDAKLAALVDGIENYCKASENYFKNKSNTIEGIADVEKKDFEQYKPQFGTDVTISLVLGSSTAVRIYTESSNVLLDKQKADSQTKNGSKYYEISNIPAHQLCDVHTVTIDGMDYEFSPMSYVYRVLNNENADDKLKEIAKATYVYAQAAEAYLIKPYKKYANMTPEDITASLTLDQKAAQMVQPTVYAMDYDTMLENCYGSIYAEDGKNSAAEWSAMTDFYQQAAIDSEAGIPFLIGQDDAHGVGYCRDAVFFPHNIGQGAANDEELAYQAGLITADEAKQCHLIWNLYPCLAQSSDPRWGRTYESYSSDLGIITKLGTAYTKGLIDGGVIACAKHFFGDGNVVYGTGDQNGYPRIIDRGDSQLSEEEINELLKVYQAQIDAGVQTIMISFTSLNGLKMHENGDYIWKLKNEMGFNGFIISDYQAIQSISPEKYEDQVALAINSGIDMLMEADSYASAKQSIIDGVNSGKITQERIDDAVTRIIKVKKDAGLFDDPFCENIETKQQETGSAEYRAVAEQLVEKSLVLLKNDNDTLPLREGAKVYIAGPAADNPRAQCGGWTMGWVQSPSKDISGVTTIQEAFERYAGDYGIEVITDPERAGEADVVLLCVGEDSYAEWYGDTEDLELCGMCGLTGNREAIEEARSLGKPTVTCIVAGRQVIIDEEDYNNWDSVVMCYLPGSEGKGISDVLCGCSDFTGRLPEPWYGSIDQIGTEECVFGLGYGLSYPEGFSYCEDPELILEEPLEDEGFDGIAEGTNYTKGVFEDGVYTNEYSELQMDIPDDYQKMEDGLLSDIYIGNIEQSLSEEAAAFNSATIWDNVFMGENASFAIKFINTELAFPGTPDLTEEEFLDIYKSFDIILDEMIGSVHTYNDRTTVNLGGKDYLREEYTFSMQDYSYTMGYYVRRLDDNLICLIEVQTGADSPEFCEEWFK